MKLTTISFVIMGISIIAGLLPSFNATLLHLLSYPFVLPILLFVVAIVIYAWDYEREWNIRIPIEMGDTKQSIDNKFIKIVKDNGYDVGKKM